MFFPVLLSLILLLFYAGENGVNQRKRWGHSDSQFPCLLLACQQGGKRAYNYGGMAPKGGLNFRKKVSLFYGKAMGVALPGKKLPGKPLLFDLAPKSKAKTK